MAFEERRLREGQDAVESHEILAPLDEVFDERQQPRAGAGLEPLVAHEFVEQGPGPGRGGARGQEAEEDAQPPADRVREGLGPGEVGKVIEKLVGDQVGAGVEDGGQGVERQVAQRRIEAVLAQQLADGGEAIGRQGDGVGERRSQDCREEIVLTLDILRQVHVLVFEPEHVRALGRTVRRFGRGCETHDDEVTFESLPILDANPGECERHMGPSSSAHEVASAWRDPGAQTA